MCLGKWGSVEVFFLTLWMISFAVGEAAPPEQSWIPPSLRCQPVQKGQPNSYEDKIIITKGDRTLVPGTYLNTVGTCFTVPIAGAIYGRKTVYQDPCWWNFYILIPLYTVVIAILNVSAFAYPKIPLILYIVMFLSESGFEFAHRWSSRFVGTKCGSAPLKGKDQNSNAKFKRYCN